MTAFLRIAVAIAAVAGLGIAALNLLSLDVGAMWTTGAPGEVYTEDARLLFPRAVNILIWGVGYAVLALVIVWRVGHRREILMAGLFLAFVSAVLGLASSPAAHGQPWLLQVFGVLGGFMNAAGVRFTQLFPRPLRPEELLGEPAARRPTRLPRRVLALLLRPWLLWPIVVGGQFGAIMFSSSLAVRIGVIMTWCLLATLYLYTSYRHATPADRQRIFWILEGVAIFFVANLALVLLWAMHELGVVSITVLLWSSWLDVVKGGGSLACFVLAIFFAGAFDAGLVLRRTAVTSMAGSFSVVVFIVFETTISDLLTSVAGARSRHAAIVAGVIAALAFRPVAVRVERRIGAWTRGAQRLVPPEASGKTEDLGVTVERR
jgi:hypothetical protein